MTAWLGIGIAPLGLMAAWMALLNCRDRRRDAIEATVGHRATSSAIAGPRESADRRDRSPSSAAPSGA